MQKFKTNFCLNFESSFEFIVKGNAKQKDLLSKSKVPRPRTNDQKKNQLFHRPLRQKQEINFLDELFGTISLHIRNNIPF